jgi:cell division cycle 14
MGKAVALGHFNYKSFDPVAFKKLAQLENGDLSWIVPKKFIAFSGPLSKRRNLSPGVYSLLPEEYVPIFKQLGVTCIVRFNNKCYDKTVFERGGIRHVDLFYEDGGNPTEAILQSFLKLCENETGAIAVHCKAGLGRTGTNIVAYMIKHYGYTVREATAWHRLCRPGAVVGPQQQFLQSIEQKLQQEGEQFRLVILFVLLLFALCLAFSFVVCCLLAGPSRNLAVLQVFHLAHLPSLVIVILSYPIRSHLPISCSIII